MESARDPVAIEFPRPFEVDKWDRQPWTVELAATEGECRAVARRLGIVEIGELRASVGVRPNGDTGLWVEGRLDARVVLTCVVTLKPLARRYRFDFATEYEQPGAAAGIAEDNADRPEIIVSDRIDLGEEVVQQLAMAIEPYPRDETAAVEPRWLADDAESDRPDNPFAALRKLRSPR